MSAASIKIGVIGLGTVGAGVVRALRRNGAVVRSRCGVRVEVRRVVDLDQARLKAAGIPPMRCSRDYRDVLSDPDIQIVVELIGGTTIAREVVTAALKAGKHVVTANKALLATYWNELFTLAHEQRCALGFESSVMAGVPVIRSMEMGLAGNEFHSLLGILNGTSNFILTRMAHGLEFSAALAEAQAKGLAEANASLDIDGYDAMQKLSILGSIATGRWLPPAEIHREGIGHVSQWDIDEARRQFGYVLRPLAVFKRCSCGVEARVHPTFIPQGHPLASIENEFNALLINADTAGAITLSGRGAGEKPAASGVVSDIVTIARAISQGGDASLIAPMRPVVEQAKVCQVDNTESTFYLRFTVLDRPKVLASIAGALGARQVSIATCHQRERSDKGGVPVIMTTHRARGGAVREALAEIDAASYVKRKTVAIRIEE